MGELTYGRSADAAARIKETSQAYHYGHTASAAAGIKETPQAYHYGRSADAAARIKEISGVNPLKCMKCGKCSATCPAFDEMDIKPHQFVSYVQNGDIEALVNSRSLWKCLSCFACVERCPRDVKPGKLIDAARQLVVRERGQNYLKADDIPELLDPETPQQLLVSAFRRYRR